MSLKNMEEKRDARLRIIQKHIDNQVSFVDEFTAYIDEAVVIGRGTVIGPCVTLQGKTVIGEDCFVGQNTVIKDSKIDNKVDIKSSVITESSVGSETTVGPFAYLRPGSNVGQKCKVGDFVEIKNSTMGNGAKASHLTYIGDADIGKNVNLGCGVVFVNYDGTNKYRSVVEDNAFVGCNSNLVSPVRVGEGAYIAAGSTVTDDVEADSLYIARSKAVKKSGWASAKGILKK